VFLFAVVARVPATPKVAAATEGGRLRADVDVAAGTAAATEKQNATAFS
jgi:hypothetical protein